MKVFAALVLIIGSAASLGSGPYLPSGWKPEGPAFMLPSEVQRPLPPIDIILQGSESASSDFLREYGPPNVVQETQNLPELSTKQTFIELEAKFGQDEAVEATTEVVVELKSGFVNEDNTEEEQPDVKVETEENEVKEEVSSISAKIKSEIAEDEKLVEEGLNNIANAIVELEKEAVQEIQTSQDLTELKSSQQSTGSVELQKGFLNYGPPGFTEYGPPKQDSLLRNAEEEKPEQEQASNETRRRRYSPKFSSTRKQRKALKH